jgi:hypothetical protein
MDKNKKLHNLDEQIQQKLENFEVSYNPDHWDKMRQSLDALDVQDADFDSGLRARMSNLDVVSSNIHWDKMASKLKALDAEDAVFDETMKERLDTLQKTYRDSHWQMMNQRLDEEYSWRNKIVRFKVAEVALMALLLFTVFNYLDTEGGNAEYHYIPNQLSKSNDTQNNIKSFNKGTDWRIKNSNQNTQPATQNASKPIVSIDNMDNNLYLNNTQNALFFNQNTIYDLNNTLNIDKENAVLNTVSTQNIAANEGNTEGVSKGYSIEPFNTLLSKSLSSSKINSILPKGDIDLDFNKNSINRGIAETQQIQTLRPKALTINSLYEEPIVASAFNKKKNRWWRFGIMGTTTVDMVASSFISTESFTRSSSVKTVEKARDIRRNKGAGLTVGFKRGKVEVESGLTYNEKQYTPVKVTLQTGSISTNDLRNVVVTPKTVDLDIVSIPLSINYYPIDRPKWSVYTKVGGTFNTLLATKTIAYTDSDSRRLEEQKNILALKSTGSTPPNIDINEQEVPVYKEGILRSHDFKQNIYVTAQAAIGAEYKISNALSVYLQPTYDMHVGKMGIGSRNDRLNTLSLQAGLKMNFKKN